MKTLILFLFSAAVCLAQIAPGVGSQGANVGTVNGTAVPSGAAGGVLTGTYPNPGLATSQTITALSNLTTNGYVKTGGGVGTLSVVAATSTVLLNYVQATDIGQTTVSATTWTTLLADQTFTVTNASAPIDVFIPLAIQVNDASISIGTYVKAAVRIQIDDTTNYFLSANIGAAVTLNSDVFWLHGASINIGTLSAAAHTIRVQVYSDTGLTSGASGFYCRALTAPNTEFLTMQVIQRG